MEHGQDVGGSADSTVGDRLTAVGACLGAGVLGLVCTLLWGQVFLTLLASVTGTQPTDLHVAMINPPVLGLGMLTGAVLFLRMTDRSPAFFDLRRPDARDALYVGGGVAALLLAAEAMPHLFAVFDVSTTEHGTIETIREASPAVSLYMVVASVLFIGPGEEILFRNVIQKRLYGDFSRPVAIVVATIVFTVVHFQAYAGGTLGQTLASLLVVFTLSLVLGWLYHRTESLVVPALVHGLYDAALYFGIYYDQVGGLF